MKILVMDLDYCASTFLCGENGNYLSDSMIAKARENDYAGFYVCTHRCAEDISRLYVILSYLCMIAHQNASWENFIWFFSHFDTIFTSKTALWKAWRDISSYSKTTEIIKNFSEKTGLKCFSASMVDDCLYDEDRCGFVYEKIIQPMEKGQTVSAEKIEVRHLPISYILQGFGNTKNPQLIQIAKDLVKQFPDTEIIMDYCDDKSILCKQALDVTTDPCWPSEKISINVFHHYANRPDAEITHVKKNKSEKILHKNSEDRLPEKHAIGLCRKIGLFSAAAVFAGYGVYAAASLKPH